MGSPQTATQTVPSKADSGAPFAIRTAHMGTAGGPLPVFGISAQVQQPVMDFGQRGNRPCRSLDRSNSDRMSARHLDRRPKKRHGALGTCRMVVPLGWFDVQIHRDRTSRLPTRTRFPACREIQARWPTCRPLDAFHKRFRLDMHCPSTKQVCEVCCRQSIR